jgi:hypothetical protein
MDTLVLGLHVLFAAVIVGPQLLLFLAVVPSTWLIDDEGLRRNVTRVVTQRFGMLSVLALVGLVMTGVYQLNSSLIDPDVRENMMDYRFGTIFVTKMTLLVALIVLVAVHGMVFGRRIRAASEAVERGEADAGALEAARRASMVFSVLILGVSVVILFLGVALGNHTFSMVQN